MLHELRIYRCQPGMMNAELQRLRLAATKYFPRHGIKVTNAWTVLIGGVNHDLYYVIEWPSLDEREKRWNAFLVDPEWMADREASEVNGVLLTYTSNIILKPIVF